MYDKREETSLLLLSMIPVIIAVGGVVVNFNTIDMVYLSLVVSILFKYCRDRMVSQSK